MRPKDATAAVALIVAVGLAVAWRTQDQWLPTATEMLGHTASQALALATRPALALTLLLTLALSVTGRVVATRRSLRSRVGYAALPSDTFDPDLASVLRFAAQLSRVRRVVRGWLDIRGSGVRLWLDSAPDGRMLYGLDAPARSRSVVQVALGTYDEVELREPGALDLGGLGAIELERQPAEEDEPPAPASGSGEDHEEPLVEAELGVGETPELLPGWSPRVEGGAR